MHAVHHRGQPAQTGPRRAGRDPIHEVPVGHLRGSHLLSGLPRTHQVRRPVPRLLVHPPRGSAVDHRASGTRHLLVGDRCIHHLDRHGDLVIRLQWLPFPSYVSPFDNPVQFLQTMILPWIVLASLQAAFYIRLTRNQVLEVFSEDYVRTARAKGLPERVVVVKHALRAGLTPIVTAAGLDLAVLLGGAIIAENIFSLPGLGSLVVS
ncbi:MAG: ABC transporter permease, partial [Chloroflexi bacterium]